MVYGCGVIMYSAADCCDHEHRHWRGLLHHLEHGSRCRGKLLDGVNHRSRAAFVLFINISSGLMQKHAALVGDYATAIVYALLLYYDRFVWAATGVHLAIRYATGTLHSSCVSVSVLQLSNTCERLRRWTPTPATASPTSACAMPGRAVGHHPRHVAPGRSSSCCSR